MGYNKSRRVKIKSLTEKQTGGSVTKVGTKNWDKRKEVSKKDNNYPRDNRLIYLERSH